MLGFVRQELLDAEREARLKAEAESKFLSALCKQHETRILDLCDERDVLRAQAYAEQERISRAHESHLLEVGQLLEFIKPTPPAGIPSPDIADRPAATYDEIMAQPASTKREMFDREKRAIRARETQRTEAERKTIAIRLESLTTEEREATRPDGVYDEFLGVDIPARVEDADHVN